MKDFKKFSLYKPIKAEYTSTTTNANNRLKEENTKLQELVRDMLRWMPCHRPCSRCERYEYPNGCEFERRRRELGVIK